MMSAFERSILHTHRSKFTQFIIFYLCLRDPDTYCQSFVSLLLSRLQDMRQPPITRCACAAYLASFLARSALAPEGLVVAAVQQLAGSCWEYAQHAKLTASNSGKGLVAVADKAGAAAANAVTTSSDPLAQSHQVFYAMFQALLYVLCYHLEPLIIKHRQHPASTTCDHATVVADVVRSKVLPLLTHSLQPLSVCLPSVAAEFVRQASVLGLADCSGLLPAADILGRPAMRPLEMFFPFDPYLLHRSSCFLELERSYVRWRGGHPQAAATVPDGDDILGGSDADAAESDDDADGDEDNTDQDGLGDVQHSDTDEAASSSSDEDDDVRGGSLQSNRLQHTLHNAASMNSRVRPRPVGQMSQGISPDMMATSLVTPYLPGGSFSSGGAAGTSPYGLSPMIMGQASPLMGSSPAPMSVTPIEAGYMNAVQARLNSGAR